MTSQWNMRFGFLPVDWSFSFPEGKVIPLACYEESQQWMKKYAHKDGFLYAPTTYIRSEGGRKLPNTERPGSMFRVPATHDFEFSSVPTSDPRHDYAAFVMYFLGLLLGVRPQFEEWSVELRVRVAGPHGFHPAPKHAQAALSRACLTWRTWNDQDRQAMTTLLFMFSRTPGYQWTWERFMFEYVVLDGLFAMVRRWHGWDKGKHADRISRLCSEFSIPDNSVLIKQLVDWRNDLAHEATWAGVQPCTPDTLEALTTDLHLRRLNSRLLLSALGYQNSFTRSPWWYSGNYLFD